MLSGEEIYNPNDQNLTVDWSSGERDASRTDKWSVKFFPFAAVGGALWATGNIMSVPVTASPCLGRHARPVSPGPRAHASVHPPGR